MSDTAAPPVLQSLTRPAAAVVVGSAGGLGAALAASLAEDPTLRVTGLSRRGEAPPGVAPAPVDVTDEASIARAAAALPDAPSLVIVATGYLHGATGGPEKSWSQIAPEAMAHAFAVNATAPALLAKHLLPIMPRDRRTIFAVLTARVGSISDNRAGGWYGYRASKAAANQIVRCLAIEGRRKMRHLIVAALQPGTVRTALSAPFRSRVEAADLFEPEAAARALLGVLDGLTPEDSGRFFDWSGAEIAP